MGSRHRIAELERLFAHAERQRCCLATVDPRLRDALRRLAARDEVVRPARSVYARRSCWESLSTRDRAQFTLRALQKLHPDWVFCFGSAALAYDLPASFASTRQVHVATTRARRARATRGVRFHVMPDDEDVCVVEGIRVTSFERTLLDCMRTAGFKRALALADAALRSGRAARGRLEASFLEKGSRQTGVRHAARALRYADARSESAGESVARAAMIEQGFALPDLQVSFKRPLDEGRTYRVDFLWMREDGSRVIGEFDGRAKYEDASLRGGRDALRVLEDERRRESRLTAYGMPIVRFSYRDVMNATHFARLLKRFGVPWRREAADEHGRLSRSRSTSAKTFCFVPF